MIQTTRKSFISLNTFFRPDASLPLDFISVEKIDVAQQPDPYSHRLTFVLPKTPGGIVTVDLGNWSIRPLPTRHRPIFLINIVELNAEQMQRLIAAYEPFSGSSP